MSQPITQGLIETVIKTRLFPEKVEETQLLLHADSEKLQSGNRIVSIAQEVLEICHQLNLNRVHNAHFVIRFQHFLEVIHELRLFLNWQL